MVEVVKNYVTALKCKVIRNSHQVDYLPYVGVDEWFSQLKHMAEKIKNRLTLTLIRVCRLCKYQSEKEIMLVSILTIIKNFKVFEPLEKVALMSFIDIKSNC